MADRSTLELHLAKGRDALGRAARELLGLGVVAPTLRELLGHAALTGLIESVVPESAPRRLPVPILSPREMDLRARAQTAVDAFAADPRAPFLRTILAAPDDDAPRLVYADWLDDRGDAEHAQLVRESVKRWDGGAGRGVANRAGLIRIWHRLRHGGAFGPFGTAAITFKFQIADRGLPAAAGFQSVEHAMRWARALATWLPVKRVETICTHPAEGRTGDTCSWEEAARSAGYPAHRGPLDRRWVIPADVFRYLGPFRRYTLGQLSVPPDAPDLQRPEGGDGRRWAIYRSYPAAQRNLAEALADYARAQAGYRPLNNPNPLPT